MLSIYRGAAFNVYYILSGAAMLIFAAVMLRGDIFSRATAYLGLLAGVLMLIPSTAGTTVLVFAFASLPLGPYFRC